MWTGDICVRHADGSSSTSAVDDLIVSRGYKISPAEITRALLDHPDVSHARVLPVVDPVRASVARAIVVPAPGVEWSGLVEACSSTRNASSRPTNARRKYSWWPDDNGGFTPR